ncbi:8295_t:CDS:2 [Gigaspora rosea]|nr:8295_t:CDS:2 [Gigaspora rosea]
MIKTLKAYDKDTYNYLPKGFKLDRVVLASCSTTNLKTEIKRYIKNHGVVTFLRPVVFDDFNKYRSAVDILNNLRDNALSYHDVLTTKCSENRILAFYFSIAEANSFSAYCQFVPEKENMKHVDFRKQLAMSILELRNDPATLRLKGKRVQRRCLVCHKRTTTACSCLQSRALCTNCWAGHIRDTYSAASTSEV